LIIGSFAMDMNAGSNQVVQKALSIARQAELEREKAMINRLITTAAKGSEAVLTLDETLEAVHAGRIQHLVLAEGFRQAGYRCQSCDYLTVQPLDECPFCGGTFREIEDAVEFAVRKVLEDGGEVEVISHASGLEEAGKIGALLRY
jgi:peptide subunit release factor 1 (eRF1)